MASEESAQGSFLEGFGKRLLDLAKALLGTTGTGALGMTILYGLGFIVANVSLLRHGVFELSLLREHSLAAGLSFSVFSLLSAFSGWAVVGWLVDRLDVLGKWIARPKRGPRVKRVLQVYEKACNAIGGHPPWRYLAVLAMAAIAFFPLRWVFSQVTPQITKLGWLDIGDALFVWGYLFSVVGGVWAAYLSGVDFSEILPGGTKPDIARSIRLAVVTSILFLSALITYGGWVYPRIPRSFGGGSPLYVEFIVDEEAVPTLEALGISVGEGGLTQRVELLTQTDAKVIVVTQEEAAVSFDAALVKASSYFPVNYYASAEKLVNLGDWHRERGKLDEAITEYEAALRIDSKSVEALVGLGATYVDQYVMAAEEDQDTRQEYRDEAEGNLDLATLYDPRCGQAHYELARLYAQSQPSVGHAREHLGRALDCDPDFCTMVMEEPDFDDRIKTSGYLRRALFADDAQLVAGYESLGETLWPEVRAEDDPLEYLEEAERALHAYRMAADLAERRPMRDSVRSAEIHAKMAAIHAAIGEIGYAEDEWGKAIELDEKNPRYHYGLAGLHYSGGDWQQAIEECTVEIERTDAARADPLQLQHLISLYLLRGHAHREMELWPKASDDYDQAAGRALEENLPTFAGEAFYHLARLEARRPQGNLNVVLADLGKAAWLDREGCTGAAEELDFATLVAQREADFQHVLNPPMIERIEASDVVSITFHLREPRGDFVGELATALELAGLDPLVIYDQADKVVGGQAERFEPTGGGLQYIFYLKEDASYTVEGLRSKLSELLRLGD